MSNSPSQRHSNEQPQLEDYRGKFPEIPEQDLLKIVEKYASEPELCQVMLERESKKCLYGSSPTLEPAGPLKPFAGARNKPDGATAFDLPRSNSTGSTGSGHSSGRSTPVNSIPTPWVLKGPTSAGHGATPVHCPVAGLPQGVVLINGNYYQPVPGAAPHVPIVPYHLPGHPPMAAGQVSPSDQPLGNSPSASAAPNRTNKTSPNSGYPGLNNGYFPTTTSSFTMSNQTLSMGTPQPTSTMTPGIPIPTGYFTPTSQPSGYIPLYYQPVSPAEISPYTVVPSSYPRYDTSPGSAIGSNIPPDLRTSNVPTSTGFKQASSTVPTSQPLMLNDRQALSTTPNRLASHSPQIDKKFQPNPMGITGRKTMEPLYVSTGVSFHPDTNSPEMLRKFVRSGGSVDDLQQALGLCGMSNRQPIANDDYMRACLSRQLKRYEKLKKEYNTEKERLEIVINDISEQDASLYDMKYVVAPNPTDEQVSRLARENDELQREIDEISKNIDRLENGQAFLPPVDGRIHDTQRLHGASKHRDTFDRSISVPCLHQDPARVPPPHPPLSRPRSEFDLNQLVHLDKDRVQYRPQPPTNETLQDWDFINPSPPAPNPLANNNGDDETQWSCPRCTFLNHDSLTVCEMCYSNRS